VKLIRTDKGKSELVIENLENLKDSAALVVTREGGNFKIGLAEDVNGSFDGSKASSHEQTN